MLNVAYTSPFVPPEWIAACGCVPRRVVPTPGAAARSSMPVTGVCPFARAFVGEVRVGDGIDVVVVTSTCDQMRRSAEFFQGTPAFLMNVPATWRTPAATRLYVDELRRLGRFLVHLGGAVPTDDSLAEVMDAFDARRAELRGALGPLDGPRASRALAAFSAGDPRELEVGWTGSPSGAEAAPPGNGIPVAMVGGPLMRGAAPPVAAPEPGDEAPGAEWLSCAIERAGGRVVLDGTEGGERTLAAPFDRRRLREEPLMVLADAYFGRIPDAFRRPDSALYDWAAREVPASGARGVILTRYAWCDMWAIARDRLAEATGVPVLDLDFAGDADAEARAAGRIGAFVEALS